MSVQFLQSTKRTIHDNGTAFGYSIMITGTVASLNATKGSPSSVEILLAVFGAAIAFSLLGALEQFGLRREKEERDDEVIMLGNTLNFLSVPGAVGVMMIISFFASETVAWAVGPFAATITYVLFTSTELMVVRWFKKGKK